MILTYFLYFILGVTENICAILYYKTAQKSYDFACAVIDLIRGAIWLFVISALIANIQQNIPLGIAYIIGCSVGDYISLKLEPKIEKLILKVKHKGRRKKRFFLQAEKKQ
jgi:uncharacterized protein YebE (UPF0316 family)